MNTAKRILLLAVMTMTARTFADTSQLKVNGDLMIHPKQIANFFTLASKKIGAVSAWDWPSLVFDKPYKTNWGAVQARGPFRVRFNTANLARQEVGFELDWNDPSVYVGHFEIHDTLMRDVGGARLIINLDGSCDGMLVSVPGGNWKVRGNLKWGWSNAGLEVAWRDFAFIHNSAAPANVDLGQCEGPMGLHQALKDAIIQVSQDHAWMQDVLRDGVLNWIENSLGDLQVELMKAREVEMRPGLLLTWVPQNMSDAGSGIMRIAGQMVVSKDSQKPVQETLERGFNEAILSDVTESGFVLPRDTLPRMMEFLQRHGELGYRVSSHQIDSFKSLMRSRFLQFFVWPDLMKFSKSTEFYFDVSSERAPKLTNGRTQEGGVVYDVQAPLLVRQWAPARNQYLPYVDFRAPMQGRLSARVQGDQLRLHLQPSKLKVSSSFRTEFRKFRSVSTRIANSLLGSRVSDYLNSKPVTLTVPAWALGEGMSLGLKDVRLVDQTLRLPLELKSK